jgi:sigma-54 dependent transcriptional regulator, acetoin dehydrogenase operon transcriptional activator AcoR
LGTVSELVSESTLPSAGPGGPKPRAYSLALEWLAPIEARRLTQLNEPVMLLGRGAECSIHLPSRSVSRKHAEIRREGPVLALRDLGSRNGCYLNGRRADHVALAAGDLLRLGECVARVVDARVSAPTSLLEVGPGIFGSAAFAHVLEHAWRAAKSSLPVVLIGETGVGKERVARALHQLSGRSGSFQALNCASVPEGLVEAEIFGFRKGAFTGADRAGLGRMRAAHEGTLFLDEVAELPLSAQAKLLRVLEEGDVVPLGETRGVRVDVRVIAATQRPLPALVADGHLRQDFKARLSGLVVSLPPLRERRDEILLLFEHFVATQAPERIPACEGKLVEALYLYGWPDNVRELELLARRLLAVHGSEPVLRREFCPELQANEAQPNSSSTSSTPPPRRRREHDLDHLRRALLDTRGNVTAAAARLGFSRQRAYRLMQGQGVSKLLAHNGQSLERRGIDGEPDD